MSVFYALFANCIEGGICVILLRNCIASSLWKQLILGWKIYICVCACGNLGCHWNKALTFLHVLSILWLFLKWSWGTFYDESWDIRLNKVGNLTLPNTTHTFYLIIFQSRIIFALQTNGCGTNELWLLLAMYFLILRLGVMGIAFLCNNAMLFDIFQSSISIQWYLGVSSAIETWP